MTKKQTLAIALMCAFALLLAGLMLFTRQDAVPTKDAHGHDDRGAQTGAAEDAGARGIAMTEAQIKANGIALDTAAPATLRQRLHLPAQVKTDAERTVAAMIAIADEGRPPLRLALGSSAYENIERVLAGRLEAIRRQKAMAFGADRQASSS